MGTPGTQCSTFVSMYLDKYKRSVFFSLTLLIILFEKNVKTVRHVNFTKFLSWSLFLIYFCIRDGFYKFLQRVLIGFSICSARFLMGFGRLLLWFLRKRNKATFTRNITIERVIKFVFFWCRNLIGKVSSMLLVSKIANFV